MSAQLQGGGSLPTFKGTTRDGCVPDARVVVDGVEIPYCNEGVETHVRKDGPADVTRESTVVMPIVWGEESVAEYVNGLSGQTPKRQPCAVELISPYESSDGDPVYRPIHSGFISAAGGHPDQGAARFRVNDYAHLLGEIPASTTFAEDATLRTVLEYVTSALIDGQEVIDRLEVGFVNIDADTEVDDDVIHVTEISPEGGDVTVEDDEDEDVFATDDSLDVFDDSLGSLKQDVVDSLGEALGLFEFDTLATPRSFSADRDTLADVLGWVDIHLGVRWYFQPQSPGNSPRLVIDGAPTRRAFHDADHATPTDEGSTGVKILTNNALFQLNPPHKLKARGRAASTVEAVTNVEAPMGEFHVATAVYGPLEAQSADDYPAPEIEVDTITPTETANAARNELKDRLDSAAGGEIELVPSPTLRPYSRLDAVPVCGSAALTSLPPVAYEVEETIHYATTAHGGSDPGSPRTVVRCGLFIDEDEIETTTETRSA